MLQVQSWLLQPLTSLLRAVLAAGAAIPAGAANIAAAGSATAAGAATRVAAGQSLRLVQHLLLVQLLNSLLQAVFAAGAAVTLAQPPFPQLVQPPSLAQPGSHC